MDIYIDESGTINNRDQKSPYFIIAMVRVTNKKELKRAYKRFVSSNLPRLRELDCGKVNKKTGKVYRDGGKMFLNDKFRELKGNQFDITMKKKFVEFFSKETHFELFYIRIKNSRITDSFCSNTARAFNYTLCLALKYFLDNKYLPDETCNLQLDERNEKTETKYFLENYLNTQLTLGGTLSNTFSATYFDSSCNQIIQIADVFANLYYSHLRTEAYGAEMELLEHRGILKYIFDFPI